jgi:hypothetical protein
VVKRLALLALLSLSEPVEAACQLVQVVELQVTMVGTAPQISVSVNGHPAQMLIARPSRW